MRSSCTSCSHCGMALCTGHFQLQYGIAAVQAAAGLILARRPCRTSVQLAPVAGGAQFDGMRAASRGGRGTGRLACCSWRALSCDRRGLPGERPHEERGGSTCGPSACDASGHVRCASRRAAQRVGQRFDARGLRFDQPELADVVAELVEDALRPDAAGQFARALDQVVQVLAVVLEAFRR